MSHRARQILIVKPSSLGDIVLALPALSALYHTFPDARIHWLIRPEFASLLEGHPYLHRVVSFDRTKLARIWNPGALRLLYNLIKDLRHCGFDTVFDFQGLLRSALLGRVTGSSQRIGMANAREGATRFYTHRIEPENNNLHLVDHYLKMVQAAGAKIDKTEFVFADGPEDWNTVTLLLQQYHIDPLHYAVFIPGSVHDSKCWPSDRFALLADKLHQDYDLPVVAVGSGSEKQSVDSIAHHAKEPLINLAGQTSLKSLCALLRNAKLVVSNDTGPGHIAAGLGVPLVMLFSWSNPARIYPYNRPECMVAIEPFARDPKIIKSRDPRHHVENIFFDTVYVKVKEQLQNTACP